MAGPAQKGVDENAHVVLIDETGVQLTPLRRRTWAKRGCRPLLRQFAGSRQKLSAIAALTISPKTHRRNLYFQTLLDGSYNSARVAAFLRELLKQLPGRIMVVWDNGIYQITGSQPTPGAGSADLVVIARGAGIARSAWAADEADFDNMVAASLKEGGPTLIAARIDGKPAVGATQRDPVQIRERFMRGLGARTGPTG